MTTWNGWAAQLLAGLGVSDTGTNRLFLSEWAKADGTTCASNPLAATVPLAGSTHCHHVGGNVYVQAYTSRAHGIAATVKQLEESRFAAILAALKTGEPYTYKDWQEVVGALGTWGAHDFASQYSQEAQQAQGAGTGGGGIGDEAGHSLRGYRHLSHVLARTVPHELRQAQRLRAQALAKLHGRA